MDFVALIRFCLFVFCVFVFCFPFRIRDFHFSLPESVQYSPPLRTPLLGFVKIQGGTSFLLKIEIDTNGYRK